MERSDKTILFEETPIPKAIMTLAVPTVISSLVMVLYNLADTYFVGMLNNPVQTAAVTLASPVLLAFNAVNNLFGVGGSSVMSRALGRKDYDLIRRSSAFSFYCSLISGILFSLLCFVFRDPLLGMLGADANTSAATMAYLNWTTVCGAAPAILNVVLAYLVRSEGASLHASIGTMSGCLLNMILDPFFILPWGLNLGAAGAGLATFLSNCAACVYFFVLLYKKRGHTYISLSPKQLCFRKNMVLGVFTVGVPASVQNLLNVLGMTILNNFTSVYGADAVAAMGIAYKVNMVPFQIALGFSQGIMPLVSYTYASGNRKRMKDSIVLSAKIVLPAMTLAAAGFWFGSEATIRAFMENEQIIAYGSRFLQVFSLSLPLICLDFLAVGVFQALGLGKYAFLFAILRKIVLEIPALYLFNFLFPLYGLTYARVVTELVLAAAAAVMLKRIMDGKMGLVPESGNS